MVQKLAIIVGLAVTLTACASDNSRYPYTRFPESRVPMDTLNRVLLDCPQRTQQIAWLERQMTLPTDQPQYDMDFRGRAKSLIWQLRSQCPGQR